MSLVAVHGVPVAVVAFVYRTRWIRTLLLVLGFLTIRETG